MRAPKLIAVFVIALVIGLISGCVSTTQPPPLGDYIFVFLFRPPEAPQLDEATAAKVQEGHMDNMRRLAGERHLVAAGPFVDDTPLRGIFVFPTGDLEAASRWLATDPAVKAGRLAGEMHVMHVPVGTFAKVNPDQKFEPEQYSMIIAPKSTSNVTLAKAISDANQTGNLALAAMFDDGGGMLILTSPAADADATSIAKSLGTMVHPWMTQKGVLAR